METLPASNGNGAESVRDAEIEKATTRELLSPDAGTAHATVTSFPSLTRHEAHGGGGVGGSTAAFGRSEGATALEAARSRVLGPVVRRLTMLRAEA